MSEQNWKPLFRAHASTVTRVLRSPAFRHARERSGATMSSAQELRTLAEQVEALDYEDAPLSAVADRVAAAVRFLRTTAECLDRPPAGAEDAHLVAAPTDAPAALGAGDAARERLVIAALHYLVTRDDLVPDFRPGGYLDDVLALTWVFGVAAKELAPFLADGPEAAGLIEEHLFDS